MDTQLGRDLPEEEKELFALEQFPLFDAQSGLKIMGNEEKLKNILGFMVDEAIPEDERNLQKAYAEKDWNSIENLAHKMKGGAIYCGTLRMQYACQYLERYRKAGHLALLEDLYQQLLQVLQETKQAIKEWLV